MMYLVYEVCTECESFLEKDLEDAVGSMWASINKFNTDAWVNVYEGPSSDPDENFNLVDMIPFATIDENLSVEFIPESYMYSSVTEREVIHIVEEGIILEEQELIAGEWVTTEEIDKWPIDFDEFYYDYVTELMEDLDKIA